MNALRQQLHCLFNDSRPLSVVLPLADLCFCLVGDGLEKDWAVAYLREDVYQSKRLSRGVFDDII